MTTRILRERLNSYLEAEAAILRGQSYTIGDRELRRADLSEVRRAISDLQDELNIAEGNYRRVKRVTFID